MAMQDIETFQRVVSMQRLRVLVLARRHDARAHVLPVVYRALYDVGRRLDVECFDHAADLLRAFGDAPADIVIVEDDLVAGRADVLVDNLRCAAGGRAAQVLVLGGERCSARLEELGACDLPAPLDVDFVGLALSAMGARVVAR